MAGAVVVVLAGLESALRIQRWWRARGAGVAETALYTEFDPLLGWRKRPGARATYRRDEYTTEVAINAHGLRDPERPYAAPPGTRRVLALGDSFVEGYTVPLEQTVTQVLERQLRAEGGAWEVLNGGTTAYSTDQELLFYSTEGARYGATVVVLFFYYNDVYYNDRDEFYRQPKPLFDLDERGLRLRRYPVATGPVPAERLRPPAPQSRSALLEWMGGRLWLTAPHLYDRLAGWGLWTPLPHHQAHREMQVYERAPPPEIETAWVKTSALLDGLGAATAAGGARLVIVYVPSRLEVDERAWALTRVLYDLGDADWDRHGVAARLQTIAQRAGIPVLDLTPALAAASGRLRSPYLTYDEHWNARGHALAAGEVARYLKLLGWTAR